MGLQEVVQEVATVAERRAQDILDAAKAEADGIRADAREQVKAYQADRAAQADRDVAQLQRQLLSNAQFEARKLVLETESELREQLRAIIVAGLAELPSDTRAAHLKTLLTRAKDTVPSGKVWGAAQDADVLKASDYEHAGDLDIAGGLVVESEDGTIRLDLSYETLLDDVWRDVLRAESGLFA